MRSHFQETPTTEARRHREETYRIAKTAKIAKIDDWPPIASIGVHTDKDVLFPGPSVRCIATIRVIRG